MRREIEIKLRGMDDFRIDDSSRRDIPRPITIVPVLTEEAGVMPLLNDHECDSRSIIGLELSTGFSQSSQLIPQDMVKLPFADAVPIEKDLLWLLPSGLVESDKKGL
jgi:hypothetical protein